MNLHRRPGIRLILAACCAALLATACAKKESRPETPPAPPPAATADVAPALPLAADNDRRREVESGATAAPTQAGTGAAGGAAAALPEESSAGGAALWVTAPNLTRSIDRIATLLEGLRAAGGDMLAGVPEGDELRKQGDTILRGGLFARLLGLGDPTLVDLAQPVRLRISFPAAGPPMLVVALGTTAPVPPTRAGKLVGVQAPDGRYLVGIGVEPDATAAWPADDPAAADADLAATVATSSALPALIKTLGDLQAMTAGMGGAQPMPSWMTELVVGMARYLVDVSGMDRLSATLRVGAASADPPLRLTMGFHFADDSVLGAAVAKLADQPPPFGLLETIDAGGDMWVAAHMNPDGVRQIWTAIVGPTEQFLGQAVGDEWRAPLLDVLHATADAMNATDGRVVAAMRTLPNGRGALSLSCGIVAGQADAVRAGVRKFGAAVADLLTRLSDKYSFGATIHWVDAAAKSGSVDVDKLSITVPRASLGPFAAALQPGEGDLQWDFSIAVGPSLMFWTSDPDPGVIQRALASHARGGGAAAGTPPAARLAHPDAADLELGWFDMSAGFRTNPALHCPPGTTFPALPLELAVRSAAGSIEMAMDFLPGAAPAIFPFIKAMTACMPPKTETAHAP